ncbi:hypothetical protein ACRRTK_008092 [Alexandromys fortis]
MVPQKDKKPKKSTWRLHLDLTHPVEDGIFDSGNSSFSGRRLKSMGKLEILEMLFTFVSENKITVVSEKQFSKRYSKYLTRKYLKKNNLRDWLHVVVSDKETYELCYFQISQDEDGSESED